jgi:hypothetical protein
VDKVVDFNDYKKGVATTYTVKPRNRRCDHPRLLVNDQAHTVKCEKCGEEIDPFWVLLQYADRQRRTELQAKRYEAALSEFQKIKSEWSLTQRERRRIEKVMSETTL